MLFRSGGDANKLVIDVDPGKVYVQGYDNQFLVTTHVPIDKAIDYASTTDASALADYGNYVICDNVVGEWDVNYQGLVQLRDTQANAVSTGNYSITTFPGAQIGTARVRGIETYSGTIGLPSAQYKVYLTDIKITTGGKSFANVKSVCFNASSLSTNGTFSKADVIASPASTVDSTYDRAVFRLQIGRAHV